MARQFLRISLGVTLSIVLVSAGEAHAGIGPTQGFMRGFAHPLSGADHILAMVAVAMAVAGVVILIGHT